MLIALGVATAACGMGARSWAPLPEEVPMPAAAPDDPAAYRGVRFRTVHEEGSRSVESDGQEVPWLSMPPSNWENAAEPGAPFFGYQQVLDGRQRRMVWFYRLLEPPVTLSPLAPSATPTPPTRPAPGPGESARAAALKAPPPPDPPQPVQPVATLANPEGAVLDVLILSNEPGSGRYETGCGPDPVIIDGDKGWRLNRTSGRIEPVDPADFACPDND